MKILVTGGAGFIGSNFIYYILDKHRDCEVFCLDKLTYAGCFETLYEAFQFENFRFIKGDICDRAFIYKIFSKYRFDIVVNFAAESHVDRSIEEPEIFLKTNILGTQILLDAAKNWGVERFHQVSTDEVYGELPLDRTDLAFTETTPLKTSSPYSASKAAADLLCLAYYKTHNLPVTISRCSNNYGPYQFPEKLMPLMIANALHDQYLPVYGTGENVRDWLFVDDHCRAIDLIIFKGSPGEIYNIGGHAEKANIEVVKIILDELKKPYSLIKYVADRRGHDLRYAIDPHKICNELGWSPATKFDGGIRRTIQWYKDNNSWLENIRSGKYLSSYDPWVDYKMFAQPVGASLF